MPSHTSSNWMAFREKLHVLYSIWSIRCDAHAMFLSLRWPRWQKRSPTYETRLIKSFVSGKCHPEMTSSVEVRRDNTLTIITNWTSLGRRRLSVVGIILSTTSVFSPAPIYCIEHCQIHCQSGVQEVQNGPESKCSKLSRSSFSSEKKNMFLSTTCVSDVQIYTVLIEKQW